MNCAASAGIRSSSASKLTPLEKFCLNWKGKLLQFVVKITNPYNFAGIYLSSFHHKIKIMANVSEIRKFTRKEKLDIFKNNGWIYNPDTGDVHSNTGRLWNKINPRGYIFR